MTTPSTTAPERTVPSWEWPLVAALAVLSALAVVIATRHGVPVTADSVTYLAAAHNLADGRGFVDFTGQALTNFPPGYPVVLALGDRIGVDPLTFGRYVGAIVFAGIVVLTYLLLRRHVRSTPFVLGGTVLVACSTQLLIISGAIASDEIFVALVLAFVLVLDHIRTAARHRGLLAAAAAALVAVAFLDRYAAGALVLAGAVSLLVLFWRDGIASAVRRTAAFVALSLIVPVLWGVRNAASDNPDLLGFRVASSTSVPGLLKGFVLGAARVVVPSELSNTKALALVLVAVVVVVIVGWPLWHGIGVRARADALALAPIVIVVLGIAAFLLYSERTVGADDMPRQFLPIWPLLITLVAVVLEWIGELDDGDRRWRSTALNAMAVVFIAGSALWFARTVVKGTPTYYAAGGETSLTAALANVPGTDRVISNDPWRVYLRTGRQPVHLAPVSAEAGFSHRPLTSDEVQRAICAGPVTLVWFDSSPATKAMPVQALLGARDLELTSLGRVDGGELYRVTTRAGASPC